MFLVLLCIFRTVKRSQHLSTSSIIACDMRYVVFQFVNSIAVLVIVVGYTHLQICLPSQSDRVTVRKRGPGIAGFCYSCIYKPPAVRGP